MLSLAAILLAGCVEAAVVGDGARIVVSTPQVDGWEPGRIVLRSAWALVPAEGAGEEVGTLTVEATTRIEPGTRLVLLDGIRIPACSSLAGEEAIARARAAAEKLLPGLLGTIPLDMLLALVPEVAFAGAPEEGDGDAEGADAEGAQAPAARAARDAWLVGQQGVEVRVPADATIAVAWDGEPEFVPDEESQVERSTNARPLVVRTREAGALRAYFVCVNGAWFRADSPTGPWQAAAALPSAIRGIPADGVLGPLVAVEALGAVDDSGGATEAGREDGSSAATPAARPRMLRFRYGPGYWRVGDPAFPLTSPPGVVPADAPPGLEPWWPLDLTRAWGAAPAAPAAEPAPAEDRLIGRDGAVWAIRDGAWFRLGPDGWQRRWEVGSTERDDPVRWRLERERLRREDAATRQARWAAFQVAHPSTSAALPR